jgi:hypothetical protein
VVAIGAGILALFALLPSFLDGLRLLHRPLNVAPATETMVFALSTYGGVRIHPGTQALILGAILVVCGCALCLRPPHGGKASPRLLEERIG